MDWLHEMWKKILMVYSNATLSLFTGADSNRGSVRAVEMYKRRANSRRRSQPAECFWTKQIGREKGHLHNLLN